MNVFVTSPCPKKCARNLDNKRLVKMVLETTQLLSTANHFLNRSEGAIYKIAHANHPCSVWARTSPANYSWLWRHLKYLCQEYTRRYKKTHKCQQYLDLLAIDLTQEAPTVWENCTPHKSEPDVFLAYRQTLQDKWISDIKSGRRPKWN